MGVPAGYFSAHTYKSVKGTEWKKATLMTALLWPGVVVGAFFVLNFFIWGQASSGAMPLGTMLALLLMWFGVSVHPSPTPHRADHRDGGGPQGNPSPHARGFLAGQPRASARPNIEARLSASMRALRLATMQ